LPQATVADVSVVISTYNRPKALNLALAGLSQQRVKPQQILVGDDGSGPETKTVIQRWAEQGLPIEHIWHEDLGYRKTIIMNKALATVRSARCVFLDGDCVPLAGFLEDHVRYSEQGYILAGPRILASESLSAKIEGEEASSVDFTVSTWLLHRIKGDVNRLAPLIRLPDGQWRKKHPRKWELVRGCNFSLETKHALEVGGFEESLYGWGPDDSDIAVRLINLGLRVKSLRFAAPVLHLWHKEEDRGHLQRNREYLADAISSRRIHAVRGLHTRMC
jgi:GT2 family glycosyltransferase